MTQQPGTPIGAPGISPPLPGGVPVRQTSWPIVLGVIFIVLAILGILSNVCGGVVNAILPALLSGAAQKAGNDPIFKANLDVMQRYMPLNIANAVMMTGLGILLLIGGIGLVRRRRKGVGLSKLWAILRMIWSVPAAYLGYRVSMDTMAAMEQAAKDSNKPMPEGLNSIMQSFGVIGVAIGVFFVCVLPIFTLIWLNRAKIKSETANWS